MKYRLLVAGFCAAFAFAPGPSFSQANSPDNEAKPIKPGGVRIFTRAPEPDKWNVLNANNGTQRIFKCKPLACPDPETVTFTFLKSPTRKPDPKALDHYAKVELPKGLRAALAALEVMMEKNAKIETLVAKTDTLKGYPSVINESRVTGGKTPSYIDTTIIFAGPVMIRVQSSSANRELAQNSLQDFINVMTITEGPPLPQPPSPAAPKPSTVGTETL